MKRIVCILALLLALAPPALWAKPIAADLSDYSIKIDSAFIGTSLLLFGARNDIGDVVITIRGPEHKYTVRKKERIMGLWINSKKMVYDELPSFYAMASTKALGLIRDKTLFGPLKLGVDSLAQNGRGSEEESKDEFRTALLQHQYQQNLYLQKPQLATFMGETLFKTRFQFPDNTPRGAYTAEVYMFSDGELTSVQTLPINVVKVGLDALTYDMAHNFPAIYGFLAIGMALALGWVSNLVFRKV